jgi:hypothetical protein
MPVMRATRTACDRTRAGRGRRIAGTALGARVAPREPTRSQSPLAAGRPAAGDPGVVPAPEWPLAPWAREAVGRAVGRS